MPPRAHHLDAPIAGPARPRRELARAVAIVVGAALVPIGCAGKTCTEELVCVATQAEADERNAGSECGGYAACAGPPDGGADAPADHHDAAVLDTGGPGDAAVDEADAPFCGDAVVFVPDGGSCATFGCPDGSVCIQEIGGPAIAPTGRCITVPAACADATDCACLAACACPGERCDWGTATTLLCDDGVR